METNVIEQIQGKTFDKVYQIDDEAIVFERSDGEVFKFHHVQDCCESVYIESVVGDLDYLMGAVIEVAEERCESGESGDYESYTYTFYAFRSIKGSVDVRWNGHSNGYYSEAVYLSKKGDWNYED